jgi:hypothetical protein
MENNNGTKMNNKKGYATDKGVNDLPADISKDCNQCAKLTRNIGIMADMQTQMFKKLDEIYHEMKGTLTKPGWLPRLAAVELRIDIVEAKLEVMKNGYIALAKENADAIKKLYESNEEIRLSVKKLTKIFSSHEGKP